LLDVVLDRSLSHHATFILLQGHAPLLKAKEYFYTRYFFGRLRDCWDRPICSRPGAMFDLIGREFDGSLYGSFQYTGEKMRAINLGSYNYLGFAENAGKCIDDTIEAVNKYGISTAGRRMETGTTVSVVAGFSHRGPSNRDLRSLCCDRRDNLGNHRQHGPPQEARASHG
jgi:hypothetical protein